MFRNDRILSFFLLAATATFLATGCFFKPAQDTKPPVPPQIGVIDMNKAIKAHPNYQQLTALQQQYNALAAKLESQQAVMTAEPKAGEEPLVSLPEEPQENIGAVFEQEYNTRMAAKQAELNATLDNKTSRTRNALAKEQQVFNDELDKQVQPQIFSLQLKLKTVQLGKEEMAALQVQLEQLQKERAGKVAVKEQELAARLDAVMVPEKSAAEEQLAVLSQQLNEEIGQKAAAKAAQIAARNQTVLPDVLAPTALTLPDTGGENEKLLAMKQQEIASLQQAVVEDIRDKAAKIAAERGLEAVLTNVQVNSSAVDITSGVINEFSAFSPRLQ